MTTPTATYVFALVAHARRPALPRGCPSLPLGSRPAVVPVKPGWWLVVCEVPLSTYGTEALAERMSNLEWISSVAVAHEGVIAAFMRADAVVPLKLFTIFSSQARALQHFLGREEELNVVIARVARSEEWGVRVAVRAEPVRAAVRPAPAAAAADGASYLRGKKAQYQAAASQHSRVRALASELFESLADLSADARQRELDRTPGAVVLDAAFLVPRTGAARLKAAAARYARTLGVEGGDLAVTGPWPPYSFVQG